MKLILQLNYKFQVLILEIRKTKKQQFIPCVLEWRSPPSPPITPFPGSATALSFYFSIPACAVLVSISTPRVL